MAKQKYEIAILGATGAVGRELIHVLEERNFPVSKLHLLASERSLGEKIDYDEDELTVVLPTAELFSSVDIALFSAGSEVSEKWAPVAAKQGAVVIDNTSAFRMDGDVPLVIPEVNPEALADFKNKRIIANPNCSTIQMLMALKPLHDAAQLKRVVVSTYQAVSGVGQKGIRELDKQVRDLFNIRDLSNEIFPQRMAFNCIPCIPHHDKAIDDDGVSLEERKMIDETHKMLGADIAVAATCVRVPVFVGHGESLNLEFANAITADDARELLSKAPGIMVLDNPANLLYPTPADLAGEDQVGVGRIRQDPSLEHGLQLWLAADNLRKGAALNAVQIAEALIQAHPLL